MRENEGIEFQIEIEQKLERESLSREQESPSKSREQRNIRIKCTWWFSCGIIRHIFYLLYLYYFSTPSISPRKQETTRYFNPSLYLNDDYIACREGEKERMTDTGMLAFLSFQLIWQWYERNVRIARREHELECWIKRAKYQERMREENDEMMIWWKERMSKSIRERIPLLSSGRDQEVESRGESRQRKLMNSSQCSLPDKKGKSHHRTLRLSAH